MLAAITATPADPSSRTRDLGGSASTEQATDALVAALPQTGTPAETAP